MVMQSGYCPEAIGTGVSARTDQVMGMIRIWTNLARTFASTNFLIPSPTE